MITIGQTFQDIKNDLPSKSLKSVINSYFFSAGFRVLLNHRIGKYCYYSRYLLLRQLAKYYKMRLITKRGCDISYEAIIGKNVRFPHPLGIVIGEGAIIKDNVKIWQQVTLGSHGKKGTEMSYPIIEKHVKIFAGAKIFGSIKVGEYAVVGANAVVNIDVPEKHNAVGIPCRLINRNL